MKLLRVFWLFLFGGVQPRVIAHLRLMLLARSKGWMGAAKWVAVRMQLKYGVFISEQADIAPTIKLKHPVGVVIGEGVTVAGNVVVYQNVTIGGARVGDSSSKNYPSIGCNTVIFAGAVLVGNIKVGENCTIGANAVVVGDVPDGCTAVGAPARVIGKQAETEVKH